MLSNIVAGTPFWVFLLFFFLLFLGLLFTRTRTLSIKRATILPIAMLVFSFYGCIDTFGFHIANLASWFFAFIFSLSLIYKIKLPQKISYDIKKKQFLMAGSFMPLSLMMAVFFLKYTIGVIAARQLAIMQEPIFIVGISLIYGLISGIFFLRFLQLLLIIKQTKAR